MNAEQTMILSASGSIRMPKLVMSLCRRAIMPSSRSLTPPATNSTRARVSWNLTCQYIAARKAAVSPNRETVSLFGRFIQSGADAG